MSRSPEIRTETLNPHTGVDNDASRGGTISRRRRTLLQAGATLLVSVLTPLPARAAQILAVRVWPSDDYTRVTLENDSDLKV